jgi:hypothetical protein
VLGLSSESELGYPKYLPNKNEDVGTNKEGKENEHNVSQAVRLTFCSRVHPSALILKF